MASKDKHKTDENAIDRMNSHLTDAGSKLVANKKIFMWVGGGLLAVAAFVLSYIFIYRNPKIEKGFEAYNKIETQALPDSLAAEQYKQVANQFDGYDPGKLAALRAGEMLYDLGKYKEAIDYLKKFSSKDKVLASNTMVLIGDCYVNLNNYSEALNYYQQAIRKAENNPEIVPRILLKEANVYDAQNNFKEALNCYQQIKDNYAQFQLGNGMGIDAYIEREKARLGQN